MANSEKQRSVDDRETDGADWVDRANDDCFDDSSSGEASGSGTCGNSGGSRDGDGSGGVGVGLTERLTNILVDEGDGDLLLQQSDTGDRVMQFLQALDLQVMGACRADERLKPLLKLNMSNGASEDRLLAHLSQHFEPSEVGMLARCLCIPLVSIRVGKINKQGTLLCPTGTRGNLNLSLLPTSDLCISFIGDDGHTERLSTFRSDSPFCAVTVEGIPEDKSGRSFLMKIPDGQVFYFWCSEKSILLGNELLRKMKDLLKRKPSLAELTGISESRLDCFATHLRAYLAGSTVNNTRASSVAAPTLSLDSLSDSSELCQTAQFLSPSSKPLRSRHFGCQAGKSNSLYQGGLSPRSSSFKEGLLRNSTSLKSVTREKLRRRGDIQFSVVDNLPVASSPVSTMDASGSNLSGKDKHPEATGMGLFSPNLLESLGKSGTPPFLCPGSQEPSMDSSLFSPYYCWCPPMASTFQYTVKPPQLPMSFTESLSLPPLSSLLPATRSSSVLTPISPLNVSDLPPMDFPTLLPEPLVRLPLSRSSSPQILTFTPLMCDPIVHIPVIDVCSSGQGYLVSAGPAISTSIPPLHPKLVNPLIPESDSVVEKGARETLRLLISSSQTNPQLMDVFPSVMTSTEEKKHSIVATGSRGLYIGASDVGAVASSIAAMGGLVSLSEKSIGGSVMKRCIISQGNLVDQLEKSGGPGGSRTDDEGSTSKWREDRAD
ncbi:uncharacterized protein LOC114294049 [Camellia sinensis]|uniref:uncharacterized protein LOC114294049 n=1 Tax=Camellia sinensis TaxID=4442 RepID=UPI0010359441|nr:uncharacterized protein LOC114294049 [Camellia sinensis]